MIDFELDDTQQELQSAARRLFAEAGGLTLARELFEHGGGHSTDLWRKMVALDWAGLAVPEAYGGSGAGLLDLYAICLESGRVAATSPLIPSSVVAAGALAAGAEGNTHVAELLHGIATGSAIVVPAVVEPSGVWDMDGVDTVLTVEGDGFRLSGTKVLVPFAADASKMLVAARDGDGITLALVDPKASGVTVVAETNVAALPLSSVSLDGVAVSHADVVGRRGDGWALLAPAMQRGAVLRCAEISAAGESMLDLVVDYANSRVQFGKPIGSYQAVQYLCTDVGMESHLLGLLSRRAAWLLDAGDPDADRAVAAAKLYGSRAAAHMTQQAHEVFAGLAFMMEHDLHLFTRHCKHWEHDLGDVRFHSERLVTALQAST